MRACRTEVKLIFFVTVVVSCSKSKFDLDFLDLKNFFQEFYVIVVYCILSYCLSHYEFTLYTAFYYLPLYQILCVLLKLLFIQQVTSTINFLLIFILPILD